VPKKRAAVLVVEKYCIYIGLQQIIEQIIMKSGIKRGTSLNGKRGFATPEFLRM